MSSELELELKKFVIDTLALEDLSPEDIESSAPLFGDGIGLDSVDALELGVALHKKYNIKLDPKDDSTHEHFSSIKSLASLVSKHKS